MADPRVRALFLSMLIAGFAGIGASPPAAAERVAGSTLDCVEDVQDYLFPEGGPDSPDEGPCDQTQTCLEEATTPPGGPDNGPDEPTGTDDCDTVWQQCGSDGCVPQLEQCEDPEVGYEPACLTPLNQCDEPEVGYEPACVGNIDPCNHVPNLPVLCVPLGGGGASGEDVPCEGGIGTGTLCGLEAATCATGSVVCVIPLAIAGVSCGYTDGGVRQCTGHGTVGMIGTTNTGLAGGAFAVGSVCGIDDAEPEDTCDPFGEFGVVVNPPPCSWPENEGGCGDSETRIAGTDTGIRYAAYYVAVETAACAYIALPVVQPHVDNAIRIVNSLSPIDVSPMSVCGEQYDEDYDRLDL